MSIMSGDEIPDELKPFRPHLSPRFFEMRERVLDFVFSVVQPAKDRYARELKANEEAAVAQGLHPLKAREPAVLSELRQAAKERGLYNFFLPTVCGLSVLEYAPIAEILGIFRLANQVRRRCCCGSAVLRLRSSVFGMMLRAVVGTSTQPAMSGVNRVCVRRFITIHFVIFVLFS